MGLAKQGSQDRKILSNQVIPWARKILKSRENESFGLEKYLSNIKKYSLIPITRDFGLHRTNGTFGGFYIM